MSFITCDDVVFREAGRDEEKALIKTVIEHVYLLTNSGLSCDTPKPKVTTEGIALISILICV